MGVTSLSLRDHPAYNSKVRREFRRQREELGPLTAKESRREVRRRAKKFKEEKKRLVEKYGEVALDLYERAHEIVFPQYHPSIPRKMINEARRELGLTPTQRCY